MKESCGLLNSEWSEATERGAEDEACETGGRSRQGHHVAADCAAIKRDFTVSFFYAPSLLLFPQKLSSNTNIPHYMENIDNILI